MPLSPRQPRWLVPLALSLLVLILSCGCASAPQQCQPAQRPVQQPAPLPGIFSRCMGEILEVGRGERAQMSADCSELLR